MKRGVALCWILSVWLGCVLPWTAPSSGADVELPTTVQQPDVEGRGAEEGAETGPTETPPSFDPQQVLAGGDNHWGHVVVVPDAGGTIHLFSLGLAALAGIGWVRCRADSVPR